MSAVDFGCDICQEFQWGRCGETVEKKGSHSLSSLNNLGKYYRHSEVNNIRTTTLNSVNIPSQVEPVGLDRTDGKRPGGVTFIN